MLPVVNKPCIVNENTINQTMSLLNKLLSKQIPNTHAATHTNKSSACETKHCETVFANANEGGPEYQLSPSFVDTISPQTYQI